MLRSKLGKNTKKWKVRRIGKPIPHQRFRDKPQATETKLSLEK